MFRQMKLIVATLQNTAKTCIHDKKNGIETNYKYKQNINF